MQYQTNITKKSYSSIPPFIKDLAVALTIAGIIWFGMKGNVSNDLFALHRRLKEVQNKIQSLFTTKPLPTPLIPLQKDSFEDIVTDEVKIEVSEPLIVTSPTPTDVTYPTIVPGQPGSKEWEEEFQIKWNEMKTKNATMQKQVEESQKQFCQDHPSLCK